MSRGQLNPSRTPNPLPARRRGHTQRHLLADYTLRQKTRPPAASMFNIAACLMVVLPNCVIDRARLCGWFSVCLLM